MRFLCFHGRGTNARIFELQMEWITHGLGSDHDFIYVNGHVPRSPLIGGNQVTLTSGERFLGFIPDDPNEWLGVLQDLFQFIADQGPFDGVVGFSEGAAIAATLIIEDRKRSHPVLCARCAIFFCAITPADTDLAQCNTYRLLDVKTDGVLLPIPTAHVWSDVGNIFQGAGQALVQLSDPAMREQYVHQLGHQIPGTGSDQGVRETIRVIERTIERAKT